MGKTKKESFNKYLKEVKFKDENVYYAWYNSVGFQSIYNLRISELLKGLIKDSIDGKCSIGDVVEKVEQYYKDNNTKKASSTKVADIVCARAASILADTDFDFSVSTYLFIHKQLFEGIFTHAGKIRDYSITKIEPVLNGASMRYSLIEDIHVLLEYDFNVERNYDYYAIENMNRNNTHISNFISNLWEIHAFFEGNTITTFVFFIKYLKTLGFDMNNKTLSDNCVYFRDSLVRANYSNDEKGIDETHKYLDLFIDNLILGEKNKLDVKKLNIKWDVARVRCDRMISPYDVEEIRQNVSKRMNPKTRENIFKIFAKFGYENSFTKYDVAVLLGHTEAHSVSLISKMQKSRLIVSQKDKEKGTYIFKKKEA